MAGNLSAGSQSCAGCHMFCSCSFPSLGCRVTLFFEQGEAHFSAHGDVILWQSCVQGQGVVELLRPAC